MPDQPTDPRPNQERRYQGPDRRKSVVDLRPPGTGLERRRGPGRRRSDFMKAAEEGEMTQEQFLFIKAIDAYKRVNDKPFPTWTEVLEVIRKLGYRKTAPSSLKLDAVEDWTEAPDSPAFPPPVNDEFEDAA
ncbi:MAG: hypothetical protein Kow00105_18980 [Phycisphaeraceae bacterium]